MENLLAIIRSHIDTRELDSLLSELRSLDLALDQKMEDIRGAQQNVTVWERINVFTNSDAELELLRENKEYQQIRNEHARVVERIKEQIRNAIYADPRIRIKIQMTEAIKACDKLKVEHKWGFGGKTHDYQIRGHGALRENLRALSENVNAHLDFTTDPLDAEDLLNLVYDEILRESGFIE
jgi:hypothetical protein